VIAANVLDEEWEAALAHACIDKSRTWLCVTEGIGADVAWFPPGDELVVGEHFPDERRLDEANAPEHINLHRVSLRVDDDVAVTAGRMRHELEHARQYDALRRAIFKLYDFIKDDALPYRAGGLDGCAGDLINAIPSEIDANAAASMHLWERHPDEVARICDSNCRALACSLVGPEPFETLPARMVAFAFHPSRAV
jgi:hypothetical protein